jgi:3D (Asp-Asp-Asp) domain-containing protein
MKLIIVFLLCTFFQDQAKEVEVSATSYNIKGRTATGLVTTKIDEPFLAVSRDLLTTFPLNSYVEVSDCKWAGTYKVLDKMGKKPFKMIDVFSSKKRTGIVMCNCKISPKP